MRKDREAAAFASMRALKESDTADYHHQRAHLACGDSVPGALRLVVGAKSYCPYGHGSQAVVRVTVHKERTDM